MREKRLNLALLLTSLIGYLEWGRGQSAFLFQVEAEMFARAFVNPMSVAHPLTIIPVLAQSALLVTLFQREPSRRLTGFGIAGLGILLGFIFMIGTLSLNLRILSSTLPFLSLAVVALRRIARSLRPPEAMPL